MIECPSVRTGIDGRGSIVGRIGAQGRVSGAAVGAARRRRRRMTARHTASDAASETGTDHRVARLPGARTGPTSTAAPSSSASVAIDELQVGSLALGVDVSSPTRPGSFPRTEPATSGPPSATVDARGPSGSEPLIDTPLSCESTPTLLRGFATVPTPANVRGATPYLRSGLFRTTGGVGGSSSAMGATSRVAYVPPAPTGVRGGKRGV